MKYYNKQVNELKPTTALIRKYYYIKSQGGLSANENYNQSVYDMNQQTYKHLSKCHSSAFGIMYGTMNLKECKQYWDYV